MELYNAIIADKETYPLFAETLDAIEEVLELLGTENVSLSFNGGKDCTVLLYLLDAVLAKVHGNNNTETKTHHWDNICTIYFIPKEKEYPEILSFMSDISKDIQFPITHIQGGIKQGLTDFFKKHTNIKGIFMGQRKGDPNGANLDFMSKSSPGWPEFLRINPLLMWSYSDIWDFLKRYKLNYCVLYDQGYTSLGDISKTKKNPNLKTETGEFMPAHQLTEHKSEREGRSG